MNKACKIVLSALLIVVIASIVSFPVLADGAGKITVEPKIISVTVSTKFTVDIWIRNLPTAMSKFEFMFRWDPAMMELVSHTNHVTSNGYSVIVEEIIGQDGYHLTGSGGPFTNDASWATLTFHCRGMGSTTLRFSDYVIHDVSGGTIFFLSEPAQVSQIEPRPVGGLLMPVNKLEILAPYLALVGLAAALSAVVAVKRRRA